MAWAELLTALGSHGLKMVAEGIRNQRVGMTSDDPAKGGDGCPACGVHREMAEAERLLAGVLRNWPGPEPAPPERRATVLIAKANLESARKQIAQVDTDHLAPEVRSALDALQHCTRDAISWLPGRNDTNRQHWTDAHDKVHHCWEMADDFAGAWFRPVNVSDALVQRIRQLPPQDRQKILDVLGD